MIYYGKRSCSIDCSSECCYFPKPGEPIKETEINRLKKVVKNNLTDFHPQYRDIIRKTVEVDGFVVIGRFGTYLKCDTKKPGFDSGMVPYYPCVFLANAEDITNENKPCIIYPHRFSFCENTTQNDCLPGYLANQRR